MQAHGQAHGAKGLAGVGVKPPLLPGNSENGEPLHHIHQARHAGHRLGHHRGNAGPGHAPVQQQNEAQVQHDVQPGGQRQEVNRGPAVPQGADDGRQQVIQEYHRNAHEDDEDIGVGIPKEVGRGVHGDQDIPAEDAGAHGEHQGNDGGQVGGVGHIPAHLGVVLGAHPLGHGDGEAGAHPQAESDDEKVDGAGGAHRPQGLGAQQLAHDHGVHHVIELLEQQPQQGGYRKAQDQPHGAARGKVFSHN